MYKLKKYVDDGFDFNAIFPEKTEAVRQASGMTFTIQEVVDFLQVQTQNFTIENTVAKDLDDAIVKLVIKYQETTEQSQETPSEQQAEPTEQDIRDTIEGLQILADMGDEDAMATVEGLKLLLP